MISAGRVLLMPKGDYNAATTYELLDLVTYQNSSYIAKGTTTGNLPTDSTYWQLSAYGGNIANLTENFAEIETSTIAQNPHPEGDIFVDVDSNLVRATAQINVNDTIAIGTNCARTTVEALINSFNDAFIRLEADKEISTQTDLDTVTTYGNYYKSSTLFYVTNAPTGIDANPLSIFRLTVIKGPGASDVIQSIVCDDGKTYKRGFDGTTWSAWVEFATTSVTGALDTRLTAAETDIDNLELSRLKTYTADATAWDTAPTAASTKPVTSGGIKTALDNKLPTYAGDATAWDTTPTANSTNPVTSGGLKTEIDKKLPTYASGASSWDTTPTASSTKPVTSGGVKTALDNKLATYAGDATAWDTTPTANSTNPVTSGGIKTQIDTINDNKANQTVIATRQANLVASRRYEIGDQFIYNNTLYKATQVIAANTNINTGSGGNATTADNISSQINNLAQRYGITATRSAVNLAVCDGISNLDAYLNTARNSITNWLNNLDSNTLVHFDRLRIGSINIINESALLIPKAGGYASAGASNFVNSFIFNGKLCVYEAVNFSHFYELNGSTFIDHGSEIPANGTVIAVDVTYYKKGI